MSKPSNDLPAPAAARKSAKLLTATEVRDQWADVLNLVAFRGERVVVTRHGKALIELIPARDAA